MIVSELVSSLVIVSERVSSLMFATAERASG